MSCLARNSYTYLSNQCRGAGWDLFDADIWPNIQRIDAAAAFDNDAEAAFHVLCAAAFDAGAEGDTCRQALRAIIDFGDKGLNPIATIIAEDANGGR